MHNTKKKAGRKVLAGAAIGAASIAMVLGAATAASAATGSTNFGISNAALVPTSPATNFNTPGTAGTLNFVPTSGGAGGTVNVVTGDVQVTKAVLPQGMEFNSSVCAGTPIVGANFTTTCTLSADKRTFTYTQTATTNFSGPADYNGSPTSTLGLVSTGVISGSATLTAQPWTGLNSSAPTATATVPGLVNFAASGATGPDGSGNYTLTGTAQPGASITVKDATGATVGTGTADASGNWSVNIPSGVTPPLSITQSVGGQTSAPIEFNTAPLPVMNGIVAGGALAAAGLAFGGLTLVRRRSRVMA